MMSAYLRPAVGGACAILVASRCRHHKDIANIDLHGVKRVRSIMEPVGVVDIIGIEDVVGFGTAARDHLYVFLLADQWIGEETRLDEGPCARVLEFIDVEGAGHVH